MSDAQSEIDKLTKDPKGAYWQASNRGHKAAVERVNKLRIKLVSERGEE